MSSIARRSVVGATRVRGAGGVGGGVCNAHCPAGVTGTAGCRLSFVGARLPGQAAVRRHQGVCRERIHSLETARSVCCCASS